MGSTAQPEIVRLARQLERQLARRRALVKRLDALDGEIRTTRKFLRDLTDAPLIQPKGELLPGETA